MRVIGTAGHVDHGKSALVLALTGIDPDRLREEKERGLTIDLGFAWLTLPDGESVGIVDVPGHKDFIENMLAGVGSIDATLFVVAADEGVMPQTREHLAILDLLEVETGVVAVTKTDLAESEEWIALVIEDLSETLEGTVLADAPIIPVSAHAERGLEDVLEALQNALAQAEPRPHRGRPRLPIDRVFTISGFGTVVTGTLIDGDIEVGQDVEVQPPSLKARVRGLQTHKEKIERAVPGSRVAINLSGVDKDELKRGYVVTTPDWLHPTTLVDVQLRYLPEILWPGLGPFAYRSLRHNTQLKLYTGASEVMARVRLLGQKELSPGETGWVQLELQEPIAMVKGDRFIVRLPSPPTTIGGGTVVDPNPGRKHRRFRPQVIERLETLAEGSPSEILLQTLERQGPTPIRELFEASSRGEVTPEALTQLLKEGQAVVLSSEFGVSGSEFGVSGSEFGVSSWASSGQLVASQSWWAALKERLSDELSAYHETFPLRTGMPQEALRSKLRLAPKVFDAVLALATANGLIVDEGANVRLSSHVIQLTPEQQQQLDALLSRFHRQPYTPPSVKESTEAVGTEMLNMLIDRGDLVQVSPAVLFLPETYEEMVEHIKQHIERKGSIDLAQTRDMFNSSRKYAQALLEHLDAIEVTKRVGDKRILR
jgi:selenocysteine-specific elongation factor